MSGVSDRTDEEGRRELCDRVQHRAKVPCRNHTAQKGAEPSHYGAKCVRQVAKLRNHAAIAPEQAKTRGQGCHIATHCEQAVSVTGDPSPPQDPRGFRRHGLQEKEARPHRPVGRDDKDLLHSVHFQFQERPLEQFER